MLYGRFRIKKGVTALCQSAIRQQKHKKARTYQKADIKPCGHIAVGLIGNLGRLDPSQRWKRKRYIGVPAASINKHSGRLAIFIVAECYGGRFKNFDIPTVVEAIRLHEHTGNVFSIYISVECIKSSRKTGNFLTRKWLLVMAEASGAVAHHKKVCITAKIKIDIVL